MSKTYRHTHYPYVQSEEQRQAKVNRHPVVVVGGGLVGLTAALSLGRHGLPVVALDDNDTVSVGSRGICYAKRSLEIWDRLGCVEPIVAKGVSWSVGKVFHQDKLAYQFDLLPEEGHKMPGMINLQQYYVEETLVNQINRNDKIDLRWRHKVIEITPHDDYVTMQVETPDGIFEMEADWVLACDGFNSGIRAQTGAKFTGQTFQDYFLIADVLMKAPFPSERWFWFDPPFHRNQSALLHKQADDVWRIDFQLGRDADKQEEQKPEKVIPRIRAMLGDDIEFQLEWVSVYQFSCRRIDRFRHRRILFAGDSAHQVSPFGARGGNGGVQDAANVCWKLKLVIDGVAPASLMDSYHEERAAAADEDLLNSSRATDFMSPESRTNRHFRNAILELAEDYPFAHPLVNSGRLSTPVPYLNSPLNTQGAGTEELLAPGVPCPDAPIEIEGRSDWLLSQLGNSFTLLALDDIPDVPQGDIPLQTLVCGRDFKDPQGILRERYGSKYTGALYLIRPDQYIAGCWSEFNQSDIMDALARATGHNLSR